MNFITFLKDIIAPKKCYWCWKIGSFLCLKCLKSLKKFDDICYICKQKSKNYEIHNYCKNSSIFYDKIIILYHYKEKIVKKLIKNFKFYWKKEIINDFLQEINN